MGKVCTVTGQLVDQKETKVLTDRFGQNQYYIIGDITKYRSGDCYLLNGQYLREEDGLVYDHALKTYTLDTSGLHYGIYNLQGDKGYFSINPMLSTYLFHNDKIEHYIDINHLKDNKHYIYGSIANRNTFILKKDAKYLSKKVGRHFDYYDVSLYGADNNTAFNNNKLLYKSLDIPNKIKIDIPYTFGLEFETSAGVVPEALCIQKALTPVKDGSISGLEYITVPLSGSKGLDYLTEVCDILSKYCKVNEFCSLHIHVGGVPRTKLFITSLYTLAYKVQHQIHDIFPPYKKDTRHFKQKKEFKDHCKFLPSLGILYDEIIQKGEVSEKTANNSFKKIFTLLNDNVPENTDFNFENGVHVKHGRSKWEWNARYFWLSFIPLIFTNKQTVEFRYHSGTLNKYKTLNWLLLCSAICLYAEDKMEEIFDPKSKIYLSDILSYVYEDNIANYLNNYYESRRKSTTQMVLEDSLIGAEFQKDATYQFKLGGKSIYD